MTDKLTSSLRAQADAPEFTPVDLDAIVAGGSRTVRRRRVAAGAGGVVALAAAVVLAVTLGRPQPERTEIQPVDPFPVQTRAFEPLTIDGARVRVGSTTTTFDQPVYRLVRDADALVYLPADLDLGTGIGTIRARVGDVTTEVGRGYDLVGDQDGHLVAWLDDSAVPRLVVLDTRTMTTGTTDLVAADPPVGPRGELARLHDVEGSRVYLTDGRGGVVIDLETGTTTPMTGYVVDAEADVVVTADESTLDRENEGRPIEPGTGLTATTGDRSVLMAGTLSGILSPDGRWFASDDQQDGPDLDVHDTTSGERLALDVAGAVPRGLASVQPVAWLDADRVAVSWTPAAAGRTERLLTCRVSTAVCEVVAADAALPGGEGDPRYSGTTTFDRR